MIQSMYCDVVIRFSSRSYFLNCFAGSKKMRQLYICNFKVSSDVKLYFVVFSVQFFSDQKIVVKMYLDL